MAVFCLIVSFIYFWDYNYIISPSVLSLQTLPCTALCFLLNSWPLSSLTVARCIYWYVYTYILLNIICSVCVMLLVCMFSGLTIWHWIASWWTLPLGKLDFSPFFTLPPHGCGVPFLYCWLLGVGGWRTRTSCHPLIDSTLEASLGSGDPVTANKTVWSPSPLGPLLFFPYWSLLWIPFNLFVFLLFIILSFCVCVCVSKQPVVTPVPGDMMPSSGSLQYPEHTWMPQGAQAKHPQHIKTISKN